jgi:hypothetical protein
MQLLYYILFYLVDRLTILLNARWQPRIAAVPNQARTEMGRVLGLRGDFSI